MELQEKVSTIVAIISVIAIIGHIINRLINFFYRMKLKKYMNAMGVNSFFDNYASNFQTDFILPDMKEIYFYMQTGIKTNAKSIEKYIAFKNELGRNYTWNDIKTVKRHLNLENKKIQIKLHKFERILSTVIVVFALLVFLFGVMGYVHIIQFTPSTLKNVIFSSCLLIGSMLFCYILINGVNSVLVAERMEKVYSTISEAA